MDKCQQLKAKLAALPEPQLVAIDRFFDGNEDLGSIGCNLLDHPGIEVFRDVLTGLTRHPQVEAVYAQIYELDPGDDCWPFTDTVIVVGSISTEELATILTPLQPDEIGLVESENVPPEISSRQQSSVCSAWWD